MRRMIAKSHGAATIINAIATGKGASFGVDLWTKAEVELTDEPGVIQGNIVSDPKESPLLIQKTVGRIFNYFGVAGEYGAKVKTWSNIPIARGLKSSSVAANATALATIAVLNKTLDDLTIINLGVDAALDAHVTITGAFDDACASYFGGIVITDNLKRRVIKRFETDQNYYILFHVPPTKIYTSNSNVQRMKATASLVKIAYNTALRGNYWSALSLNGLIFSSALGYNPSIALDALLAGAIAAGLSGTGPSTTAIVPPEKVNSVKAAWQPYDGEILTARVNQEKAHILD